jgi:membrane peptidoglycan carboxypeptidase
MMWDTKAGKGHDLTKGDPSKLGPDPFFNHIGFGQYPITVLDHATGLATFAANGVYHKPHFIKKVEYRTVEGKKTIWKPVPGTGERTKGQPRIDPKDIGEVNAVLKNYASTRLNDRDSVSKSGTWQAGDDFPGQNSSAWYVGYTSQIATAVWVGNQVHESAPIKDKYGNRIGSGALPKQIWVSYMNAADKVMNFEPKPVDVGCGGCIGDPDAGDGVETKPSMPADCHINPNQPGCPGYDPNNPGNGGPNNPNQPDPNQSPSPGTGGLPNPLCSPRPNRPCP